MTAPGREDKPIVEFRRQSEWAAWLRRNHEQSSGVWMTFAKKDSGLQLITRSDALDTALCHGWIDGQAKSAEGGKWLLKFTPRSKRSIWSKLNCARAEALLAADRMQPAGLAEIERAKADGRWDAAYEPSSTITVPDDLQSVLDRHPRAAEFFAQLNRQNRYAILFRIHQARRPETRARKIADFVAMLERGERIYP